MLFNSNLFVLVFLPAVVVGYFLIGARSRFGALVFLVAASLVFYGWSGATFLIILVASILFNYGCGIAIARSQSTTAKGLTIVSVAANLVCLAYFKYFAFLLSNFEWAVLVHADVEAPPLPLGISFFTFTQIAFLVDTYAGRAKEYRLTYYALFVTYFPHLVAGPILHHKEMIPQFERETMARLDWQNVAAGLTIFAIDLFKKVIIADAFAFYSDRTFAAADQPFGLLDAWVAALSFGLQIYFDFSSYCDMAIGISLMLGIRLPVNFLSPYKAENIIEFWRTWHMTLSRFLRDYLYVPLGGNRHGQLRRYVNLMITMLLGGLWHGANWSFVIWGGLHGGYLIINHLWRHAVGSAFILWRPVSIAITFAAVCFAWVFFRSETLDKALSISGGMIGLHGLTIPISYQELLGGAADVLMRAGITFGQTPAFGGVKHAATLVGGLVIVWALPNIAEIFATYKPVLGADHVDRPALVWSPTMRWSAATAAAIVVAVVSIVDLKPFIYFQF